MEKNSKEKKGDSSGLAFIGVLFLILALVLMTLLTTLLTH